MDARNVRRHDCRKDARCPMEELGDLDATDRAIIDLVLAGHTNKAISRRLSLPEGTVKWRLHRLYGRLGVSSRVQFALRLRANERW